MKMTLIHKDDKGDVYIDIDTDLDMAADWETMGPVLHQAWEHVKNVRNLVENIAPSSTTH